MSTNQSSDDVIVGRSDYADEMSDFIAKRGTTLSLRDVQDLAYIVNAASRSSRVRWVSEHGDILEGTVRHIVGDLNGGFLRADEDVRDSFVRITTTLGFEVFMPMHEAVALHHAYKWMVDEQ